MAVKKKKKIKVKPRKTVKNLLVKHFEMYIRKRDNWTCFVCGAYYPDDTYNMHAGHLISRRHETVQFDETNVFAQCKSCNFAHVHNPQYYTNAYIKKFGPDQYDALVTKSRGLSGLKRNHLEEMVDKYKGMIKSLEDLGPVLKIDTPLYNEFKGVS